MTVIGRVGVRMLIAAISVVVGLSGCSSAPSRGAGSDLTPAVGPNVANFLVVTSKGVVNVVNGETVTPVRLPSGVTGDHWRSAIAVSQDAIAYLAAGWAVVVDKDATARAVPCERCESLGWTGSGLVATHARLEEGRGFEILSIGTGVSGTNVAVAQREADRFGLSDGSEEFSVAPEILAANDQTVWLNFMDTRIGNARGGTTVLSAYGLDGTLEGTTRIDGSVYASAVSPDGRFLAVNAGGSGGACVNIGHLEVVELAQMRPRVTGLPLPVEALSEANGEQPWLDVQHIWWEGQRVHVVSDVKQDYTSCSEYEQAWEHIVDVETQIVADQRVSVGARGFDAAFAGSRCEDQVVVGAKGVRRDGGAVTLIAASSSVIYSPPIPPGCVLKEVP